jgi:hypothetical protein
MTNAIQNEKTVHDIKLEKAVPLFPAKRKGIYWPVVRPRLILVIVGVAVAILLDLIGIHRDSPFGWVTFIPSLLTIVGIMGIMQELWNAKEKEDKRRDDELDTHFFFYASKPVLEYVNSLNYLGHPDRNGNPTTLSEDWFKHILKSAYYYRFQSKEDYGNGTSAGGWQRIYEQDAVTGNWERTELAAVISFTFITADTIRVTSVVREDKD